MRGKRPTRKQKELIAKHKLDYNNWLVTGNTEQTLTIINKKTGNERMLKNQPLQRKW